MDKFTDKKGYDSRQLREWVENFVMEYGHGQCAEDFQKLQPMQRMQVVLRLMAFLMPKLKAIDVNMATTMQLPSLASLFTGIDISRLPTAESPRPQEPDSCRLAGSAGITGPTGQSELTRLQ